LVIGRDGLGEFETGMSSETVAELIEREVSAWEGVTVEPHRFGGTEFKVGRREIGHLHGGRLADLPFPRRVRDQLIAAGKAEPHHILPESGWVSFRIRGQSDVAAVVALLRLNYDRPWTGHLSTGESDEWRARKAHKDSVTIALRQLIGCRRIK
jgi:hypothetical protein